jgi:DNA polymerase III delta prime subunit
MMKHGPDEKLARILQSRCVPHALLLTGPPNTAQVKYQAVLQFALALLQTDKQPENHPDIHQYFPEGKAGVHTIESIRQLTQEVFLAPYEGAWKIFILQEADKMLPTSSNALLKTLEEPAPKTILILLSHHPERLLPTLVSRCQTINFPSQGKPLTDPTLVAILAGDIPLTQLATFESEAVESVFETILFWYRDRLLLEIEGGQPYLHFPEYLSALQKTPFVPLEKVEQAVRLARLAFERSTKLSTCLEMTFRALSNEC